MAGSDKREENLRQAAAVIQNLRKRLAAVGEAEPIAIVGMACRMPGSEGPEGLWGMLEAGGDPIASFAWDGTLVPCGVIDTMAEFDAHFFRISPREAQRMDPRQRLLLETSWEALEHAGLPAASLDGERIGVYVGASGSGYVAHLRRPDTEADAYDVTGSLASVIAGRVSYFLKLRGPSMTIDTACSSSLVAVHVAIKALRARECEVALAGGVSTLSRILRDAQSGFAMGHISKRGKCRTFDASADGTVFSDGCGVVVLKRLSTAQQDGDRILAVIRGSAVNHDGQTQGLTVPSGLAQEDVIRRALAEARVKPSEVGYVECHGTGTVLGDPIEVQALGSVLAEGRDSGRPVIIGSVKSNLGHTDAAAGVAGLIKVVLSLQYERIPQNLHFDAPSPHIAWDELPVKVASEPVAWERNGVARIAGVSSFGVSGTNAHVVVEEAPREAEVTLPSPPPRSAELVVLSAKSTAGLDAAASRLASHVQAHPEQALGDIAYSLATTRSHHEHRLALAVATRAELVAGLEAASRDQPVEGLSRDRASVGRPKVVFVFPGQGSQWFGMGRELLSEEPVFREALEECSAAIALETGWSVIEELQRAAEASRLESIEVVQPTLFALEVALAKLWRSWGVEPDVVVGHSMGEVAAAYVAGGLTLADAAKVICRRSRLLKSISGQGEMALVQLPADEAQAALSGYEAQVSVAVSNSRRSTVLSGEPAAMGAVLSRLEGQGIFCKRVKVDVASHSPQVDVLREDLLTALSDLSPQAPALAMHSTVTGQPVGDGELNAAYWMDNVRQPVRFAKVVEALLGQGHSIFVELSPHPVLLPALDELVGDSSIAGTVTGSLYRERPERASMLAAAGKLHVVGGLLRLERLYGEDSRRVELPTYAWDRQRYWLEGSALQGRAGEATGHPLLGVRVSLAGGKVMYETVLSRGEHGWLYDHRVGEAALMPGAGLCELVRAGGEHCLGEAVEVLSLVLQAPLVLPEHGGRRVQVLVSEEDGRTEVSVYSQPSDASAATEWTLHASSEVRRLRLEAVPRLDLAAVRARCAERVEVAQAYETLASLGLDYGAAFRGLQSLWVGTDEALGEVVLPDGVEGAERYGIHPALLDAAFHSLLRIGEVSSLHLPFAMDRVVVHAQGAAAAWVHVRARPEAAGEASEGLLVDVTLSDAQGDVLVEVVGLRSRAAEESSLPRSEGTANALYQLGWSPSPSPQVSAPSGRWVVVAGQDEASAAVVDRLRQAGAECTCVDVSGLSAALPADHVVCLWGRGAEVEDAEAAQRVASAGLSMVQLLAQQERAPRLWWVTRGAVSVTAAEASEVAQASLWGLGRTVMQEHPELGCTLVDVEATADMAEEIVRELSSADDEQEIAWRAGERHVARLRRALESAVLREVRTDGTVVITGGLGTLGLHVARWLAQRGTKHIVLTGRRGLATPGAAEAVEELEALGARVTVSSADVSERSAVHGLLAAIPSELPLRGVVHAAGVLDDGVLSEQSAERFAQVMAAKVGGACHLDAETRGLDLDVFVLFSSAAGTLGSAGQGGYAAANACLDALAARRRAAGLPGQSLAWGLWVDDSSQAAGLASGLDQVQQARLKKSGIGALDPVQGTALLAAALARSETQLMLTPLELGALRRRFNETVPPLWRELVRLPRRAAAAVRRGGWASELASLSAEHRLAAAVETVRAEVARVLSLGRADAVGSERPLKELGLDSLMAVELRNALGRRAGTSLPATLAFDYPTPTAIAKYLLETMWIGEALTTNSGPLTIPQRSDQADEQEWRLAELSLGQQRLWFIERLTPGSALYNVHFGLKISGRLDTDLVRACLSKLVKRHEVLRTTIQELAVWPEEVETARALIMSKGPVPLEVVDLRDTSDKEVQAARLAFEHRTKPFDLKRGLLWRSLAITLEEERHLLLFTQHHLITDGWSTVRLMEELASLYESGAQDSALRKLGYDYLDFVRYERALRQTETHRQNLAWWKERLEGLPRLDLPGSRPCVMPRHKGDAISIEISSELTERLREFCRREGCTLFVTLLTAWACVLHRYSGQTDFGIGTLVARRDRSEFNDVQGFFVNTMVVRCDVSGRPTFRTLAHQMGESVVEMLQHQEVEFGEIVQEHGGERDRDLNPLIQANFDFVRAPCVMATKGVKWDWIEGVRADGGVEATAKFNLGLTLLETEEHLFGTLEYATDLFDASTVERMAAHLVAMLDAAPREPDRPIGELPLLTIRERCQLLVEWNATAADYPRDRCVHELFGEQAARTPEAVAVVHEDRELSYGELERRSNQLAHHLRGLDVGPEVIVGLCVERSLEMVVGLLGILKAGGAYLPLDPSYPAERLAYMVEDAEARVLLTLTSLEGLLPADVHVVRLDDDWGSIARQPDGPPTGNVTPINLAYVMYTSGSTGRPKGVMIGHGGVVNRIAWMDDAYGLAASDRVLQKTPFSFDVSVWEFFWPLLKGARLVLARPEGHREGDYLANLIIEQGITVVHFVPSMLWLFLQQPRVSDCTSLREVICSGEALPIELIRECTSKLPGRLENLYGPTEASVDVSFWACDAASPASLIGRPIWNTQLYVLDELLEPVPIGVRGELYIGGVGLARGYLGRPDLTANRFVASPFGAGERLYRTGDAARWLADGNLEYLGRLDDQVKVRGHRIELGEIEAVLSTHLRLSRCAVTTRPQEADSQLIAFYVASGDAVDPHELRQYLRLSLPEHMVPAVFVPLTDLPLTLNGKIDRKALAAHDLPHLGESHIAPREGLEQALAEIWKDVLNVVAVDTKRTFFEQGGTSLRLLKVQQRIRVSLGMGIAAADLFKYPTIENLAQYIGRADGKLEHTTKETDALEHDKALRDRIREIDELSPTELQRELRENLRRVLAGESSQ
ncbi:non-ribosomal peptide synthetase/type I polyketide synthase [Bradyrhizobium prioriisuperbiae]|uniref:non-ribosomal peptide synthetase/type I polyketide synthase n=1 Tax=Bradyrhizobium prioriisuperbiae TaxID=2854389 RepID=UPI0028EC8C12|nr:non-ribosomal peptide synthetase/type I polyketide synthase [Bradyrhizobium prioritasuperba]